MTSVVLAIVLLALVFPTGCNGGSPGIIDKAKTSSKVHGAIGARATLNCHYGGHPLPQVVWIRQGKVIKNCKRCVMKIDNATPGVAKLHVTPYRAGDFGEYVCKARNENGFASVTITLIKKPSGKSQCHKDIVMGKDPRLNLEYRPKCDHDGLYHRIQCSIHFKTCWCVDRYTGHKVSEAYKATDGYHCTAPKDISTESIVTISIGVLFLLVVMDIAAFAFCKRGIIHCIVRCKNKRTMYGKLRKKEAKDIEERQNLDIAEANKN